eukprot:CAMPEP_0184308004 /NCGR_PEP_ID=MMETSP1049-20130417/16587_1 /TAXON_ID=77928 /ORGANISM="Proteomonas sulcata, Strain CCMP704" /LENGTH=105 /DNA_ID=CAMNT_0026620613 /DNA_START=217 /DNA_END=534 /DNA_ORIENTATION=+
MSSQVGANVQRMARIADALQHAETDLKDTLKLGAVAQWHEQQCIRTLSKSLARQRDKDEISEEQKAAAKEMQARRAQQIKELYDYEMAQYERELASKGLVVYRQG